MAKGWTTVALKDALVAQLDRFLQENEWGFSNRAEVVTAAVREFLTNHRSREGDDFDRALGVPAAGTGDFLITVAQALGGQLVAHEGKSRMDQSPTYDILLQDGTRVEVKSTRQPATSKAVSKTESTKRQ